MAVELQRKWVGLCRVALVKLLSGLNLECMPPTHPAPPSWTRVHLNQLLTWIRGSSLSDKIPRGAESLNSGTSSAPLWLQMVRAKSVAASVACFGPFEAETTRTKPVPEPTMLHSSSRLLTCQQSDPSS